MRYNGIHSNRRAAGSTDRRRSRSGRAVSRDLQGSGPARSCVGEMTTAITRLIAAWQQVAKRSLAHWKLLSSVVLGVLLASAIMAGTVIYFDALREVALQKTLARYSPDELHILIQGDRGPTLVREYEKVFDVATGQIDRRIDWMLRGRIHGGKTQTFFLSKPGSEGQAGKDNARTYFAFLPSLGDHITFVAGGTSKNERATSPGEPLALEAIVPRDAAQLFGVGVGDRFSAVPFWEDRIPHVSVLISGVFERNDPAHDLWELERGVIQAGTGPSFRTLPFYISQEAYLGVLGPAFRKLDSTYAWLLLVDTDRLNARNANPALAKILTMHRILGSTLSSYQQQTSLDEALSEYERRLFFSKLPMYVVLILIAVVILYYVITLSSLAVEERRSEVALLRSRGAGFAQILTVFVLEGATIAGVAVLAGPILAAGTISLLGYTPAFSDITDGARLSASISRGAYLMSALGGGLSFVALIIPAIQASRIGVTQHRQEAARPTRLPAFQRYYLDVLLLLLSIFLFRQLTEQGSVVATRVFGELAVDQLLLALPGLMLVASAMVLLRLFPLAMSLSSRMLSNWLPVGMVMAVWQMARNPTHYARLSLLLILTAGLGIFASSFGATLERSFEERILYSTGSDVRVDGVRSQISRRGSFTRPGEAILRPALEEDFQRITGVDRASPVLRESGNDLTKGFFGNQFTMLAMDAASFTDGVAWFRDDFSRKSMKALLESLRVTDPPQGIVLPDNAFAIGIRLKADRPHPGVMVTARVRNAQNRHSTYNLGTLSSSEWVSLETGLRNQSHSLEPVLPLTLVSLRVHEDRASRLQAGSILIDEVWVNTSSGRLAIEPFDDADGWSLLKATADAASDVLRPSETGFNGDSSSVLFSWTQGATRTARGIVPGGEWPSVPVLASKAFVKETGYSPGDEFEVLSGIYQLPVKLVDVVDFFPTMTTPNQRFLVADVNTLTRRANLEAIGRELLPNEVWISTKSTGDERKHLMWALGSSIVYTTQAVHDRADLLATSKADPLVTAGWRALLFVAFSAVLILSCVGFLVHAYVSFRSRQLQFALLRTVGFSMRQLVAMVWLEEALVIGAGMALGTWMGGRLGATIMPFLGHDDWGGQVIPPFTMEVNWGALLLTYAAMVLVFGVISLAVIWFIQRISLQRILRLGEM